MIIGFAEFGTSKCQHALGSCGYGARSPTMTGFRSVPTTLWTAHGACLLPCGRHTERAYYLVDGTRSVPTTLWTAHGACLLPCGRHTERAYYLVDGTRSVPTTMCLLLFRFFAGSSLQRKIKELLAVEGVDSVRGCICLFIIRIAFYGQYYYNIGVIGLTPSKV